MTILFEIPLSEVKSSALEDLKSKYPGATLRIEGENALHTGSMDEDQFWAIISLFDWKKFERADIIAPAIVALSRLPEEDIYAFHDLLHQKLYDLDGRRFAVHQGSNRYAPEEDKHFSVDDFLYSRCGVVANGQVFYESVVQNPSRMPKEFTFESILYLPEKAWRMKTGRDDYDYAPQTWCETFSNPEGWPGITPRRHFAAGKPPATGL